MSLKKYLKNNTIRSFANLFDFQEILDSRHFRHSCRFLSWVCSCIHSKKLPTDDSFYCTKIERKFDVKFFSRSFQMAKQWQKWFKESNAFLNKFKKSKNMWFWFQRKYFQWNVWFWKKNVFEEILDIIFETTKIQTTNWPIKTQEKNSMLP